MGVESDRLMTSLRPLSYASAKSEIYQWLQLAGADQLMNRFIDNGYDDLEAISLCTDLEMEELIDVCVDDENKPLMRKAIQELCENGVLKTRIAIKEEVLNAEPDPSPASNDGIQTVMIDQEKFIQLEKEGYLSIKLTGAYDDDWVDKFCSVSEGTFAWKSSKKSNTTEHAFDLSTRDIQFTISGMDLVIHIPGVNNIQIVVSFEDAMKREDWFPSREAISNKRINSIDTISRKIDPSGSASEFSKQESDIGSTVSKDFTVPSTDEKIEDDLKLSGSLQSKLAAIVDNSKSQKYLTMLLAGSVFKKYKQNKTSTRLIYCTRDLSKLVWSMPKNRRTVQGFIRTDDIFEIETGYGTGKNRLKLFVVSKHRILELEAKDSQMLHEWVQCLKFMMETLRERLDTESVHEDGSGSVAKLRKEYREYLQMGDVFRVSKKGSEKQFYCDDDMSELIWKDIERSRIRGTLPLKEIVEVFSEKSNMDTKLCIVAKKNLLFLEASDKERKEKFIDALQYWTQ